MSRVYQTPLLSLAIATFWLLLNDTFDLAHLLLGVLLGVLLPLAARRLSAAVSESQRISQHTAQRPAQRAHRMGAPGAALGLLFTVIHDVVRSNIDVALLILGPQARLRSRFIVVPCALDDPRAVAILAGIVTMTPGTLSVDIADDLRTLTIHSLHAPDPQQIIDSIRARYERPLARIFRCSNGPC